jgi:hypothetical protein
MNKATCFNCRKEFEYDGEQYRDVRCSFCQVENAVYPEVKDEECKYCIGKFGYKPEAYCELCRKNREEEMANLGDLRKNLRKEDVRAEDVLSFVDAGEIKDVDFSTAQDGSDIKTVFQVTVELPNGKQKIYTPNATTRGILSDKWGEDTEKWVGKKATVKLVDQLSFGKMTKVMVLEPTE